jgi:23S rRNA A2030 N6-methylase RlmJ
MINKICKTALPYDMGNAGDLLKHGVLAEFVRWHCAHFAPLDDAFCFLDPFGGLPWRESVDWLTYRRVNDLAGSALLSAQPEIGQGCYYGSGHIVRRAAKDAGLEAKILVSDGNPESLDKLLRSGLEELKDEHSRSNDGYSILESVIQKKICADLVLIDPFADFLRANADKVVPAIAKAAKKPGVAIVLFVLNKYPENKVGQNWQKLKAAHLRGALSLSCPPLPDQGVKGESVYWAEVVLQSSLLRGERGEALRDKLSGYATQLGQVLNAEIKLAVV